MTDLIGTAPVTADVTPRRIGSAHGGVKRYGFFVLVALIFVILAILRPTFVDAGNIQNMLMSMSLAALMFLGLTWIIAAGEIDVSFMSVAALANMVTAGLVQHGAGWPVSCAAGLGVGVVFGSVNALLVGILRLPALVITIASGALAASLAAAIGAGTSISLASTGFVGAILSVHIGPLPLLTICVGALYALAWFMQEKLTLGIYIYALEQNRAAVAEAGVPVKQLVSLLYVLSGVLSAIAGIFLAANLSSGQPYLGGSYFLNGLTAVLLGGMALKMGKPNILGTFAAVVFLVGFLNGTALLGWTDSQSQIVRGVLLLIGVSLIVFTNERSHRHRAV
jgi:ribose transport system permease protein